MEGWNWWTMNVFSVLFAGHHTVCSLWCFFSPNICEVSNIIISSLSLSSFTFVAVKRVSIDFCLSTRAMNVDQLHHKFSQTAVLAERWDFLCLLLFMLGSLKGGNQSQATWACGVNFSSEQSFLHQILSGLQRRKLSWNLKLKSPCVFLFSVSTAFPPLQVLWNDSAFDLYSTDYYLSPIVLVQWNDQT